MFFGMTLILSLGEVYFEAKLTASKSLVGRAVAWVFMKYTVVPLLFSMALSLFLGQYFGAGGLIPMTAGFISTFIMVIIYAGRRGGQFVELGKVVQNGVDVWNRNFDAVVEFCRCVKDVLMWLVSRITDMFIAISWVAKKLSDLTR